MGLRSVRCPVGVRAKLNQLGPNELRMLVWQLGLEVGYYAQERGSFGQSVEEEAASATLEMVRLVEADDGRSLL